MLPNKSFIVDRVTPMDKVYELVGFKMGLDLYRFCLKNRKLMIRSEILHINHTYLRLKLANGVQARCSYFGTPDETLM